jgi:hypothetical protein
MKTRVQAATSLGNLLMSLSLLTHASFIVVERYYSNQSSHFKGKRHSMLPCERLVPGSAGSQIRLQDVSIAVSHSDSN